MLASLRGRWKADSQKGGRWEDKLKWYGAGGEWRTQLTITKLII